MGRLIWALSTAEGAILSRKISVGGISLPPQAKGPSAKTTCPRGARSVGFGNEWVWVVSGVVPLDESTS